MSARADTVTHKGFESIEDSRLSTGGKRLRRGLEMIEKLRIQRNKLQSTHDELTAKQAALETTRGFALNGNLVTRARRCEDQCGVIETEIADLDSRLADAEAGLSPVVADVVQLYRDALIPRIDRLVANAASQLARLYKTASKAKELIERSDAMVYLRGHAVCNGWTRSDSAFVEWLLARVDHLLAAPENIPWPVPRAMPAVEFATKEET